MDYCDVCQKSIRSVDLFTTVDVQGVHGIEQKTLHAECYLVLQNSVRRIQEEKARTEKEMAEHPLPPLHPSWLSIPKPFRIDRPYHRWKNVPCPKAPELPEGWRWLNVGEKTRPGDMLCDYRGDPVPSGIWKLTKNHHPTRRKIEPRKIKPKEPEEPTFVLQSKRIIIVRD